MKSKALALIMVAALSTALFVGCGSKEEAPTTEKPAVEETTDATSTASLPGNLADFEKGISAEGRWIITPVADVTSDKELVIDGEFHKKDDAANEIYRKIGLYAQDADKNVTAEYTLTAPKVVVKSENVNFVNGTIKGDVYVEANGFVLNKTKIEGNLYFASEDVKATANIAEGTVTGATEVKAETDAVASASFPTDAATIEKALSADGTWIICVTGDLATDKELVVDGQFHSKNDTTKDIARKLALYDQDADKKVTASHTLTAPKMTVKSENFKIQEGTFVGDIYVEANGFTLKNTKVEGNVYFANEDVKATFVNDGAEVTGVTEVK